MTATDLRLALPAAGAWVAAILLVGIPGAAGPVAGAAAVAVLASLLGVASALPGGRTVRALEAGILPLVAIAVVALAIALHEPLRQPAVLAGALDTGAPIEVVVALDETVAAVGGSSSATDAMVVALRPRPAGVGGGADPELAGGAAPPETESMREVRVPVVLLGFEPAERAALGSRWQGLVRLVPLEAGDDRVALAKPLGALEAAGRPPPLMAGADALRERFLGVASTFPGPGAALLPGLAIGDTSAIDAELDAAMKRSSLSHLTAVSGANCAIVVGLVLGLGALGRWPRAARVGAALVALGGFVVLVTPQASVVRAAVMAAVVLLALATGRSGRGLPVLGAAVLGILVLDPWIARDYGFALSVLATGALLVLSGPLAARLAAVMPRAIALWIAVPLAAQLACQPVLVLLAPELPLMGVVANILAAPAAPVATIVGMAACLIAPALPWLATALAGLAWVPATWIAGTARVTSGLPSATMPWPEGAIGALLLAWLTVGALVAAGVPAPIAGDRLRARAALATTAVLVVIVGATAGADALGRLGRPADWVIAQCDVGQGDAVVVRSAGRVALTDTGAEPDALAACLDELGVGRIDLLVLTHFDADHVGGVEAVVGRVGAALVGPTDGARDEAVLDALVAGGAVVEHVTAGDSGKHGDYGWRALWPPDHRGVSPGNGASLVLEWRSAGECACPSMLALGDLGRDAQESLRASVRIAPVDVVKVSHHGSNDQSAEVYAEARATLGLIGVGADNTYGHPTEEALAMLADSGGAALRSDRLGLVLIAPGTGRVWGAGLGGMSGGGSGAASSGQSGGDSGGGSDGDCAHGAGWRVWTERGAVADPGEVGAAD
ncbi:ComEC/Rec2 family competence protein [Yonghaparkia sp. Soil809]|uniref:ComEC/Rec2 family competence protein n=1 Tax=Yonghaparkia sp. Soil809 TaxID=1736417 RepID=UPI0006F8679A|nr:ComEC/Rec2 family competence protein [Yonghaparkia sp. Soil809]KRF31135.1 hypothetical protein ASG83_09965 [Yonghaparkia sp. Soil809]